MRSVHFLAVAALLLPLAFALLRNPARASPAVAATAPAQTKAQEELTRAQAELARSQRRLAEAQEINFREQNRRLLEWDWIEKVSNEPVGLSKRPVEEQIVCTVPPIVSRETFDAVGEKLAANMHLPKNGRRTYLLRGLVKCAVCRSSYVGGNRSSHGHRYHYYVCSSHSRRQTCGNRGVKAEAVEALVWADVLAFLRQPSEGLAQIVARREREQDAGDGIGLELPGIESALAERDVERGRLIGLYRRGRITDADLDRELEQVEAEVSALSGRRTELLQRANEAALMREMMDDLRQRLLEA